MCHTVLFLQHPRKICVRAGGSSQDPHTALRKVDPDFELHGPIPLEGQCTLGVECILQLNGVGFRASNELRLVVGECGAENTTIANFSYSSPGTANLTWTDTPLVTAKYYSEVYNFGHAFAGLPSHRENYTICWGHHPLRMPTEDAWLTGRAAGRWTP